MPNQNELKWEDDATTITAKGIGSFKYHVFFMNGGWYAGCLEIEHPQWESGDYITQLGAKMRCQSHHNAILAAIESAVKSERENGDRLACDVHELKTSLSICYGDSHAIRREFLAEHSLLGEESGAVKCLDNIRKWSEKIPSVDKNLKAHEEMRK